MPVASMPQIATYVSAYPYTIIGRALVNWPAFGSLNYEYSGTIAVSLSNPFTYSQYISSPTTISRDTYTSGNASTSWSQTQLDNIIKILTSYSQMANLNFGSIQNYSASGYTPANVGNLSNINISLIYRPDLNFSGESALGTDINFKYLGSAGDIIININGLGVRGLSNDTSFNDNTFGYHALMHEIGHSLGLTHPHLSSTSAGTVLTANYNLTTSVGFSALGFHISSGADMNKDYFTIMSYDETLTPSNTLIVAQSPMILDVIALQELYGAGIGSSGLGDDIITPGASGSVSQYRTYFDTGGHNTINLVNYSAGAYINLGVPISGANHLVGVSMSRADGDKLFATGADPSSLRWYYGEFQDVIGSTSNDLIYGNSLDNVIYCGGGNDIINGGGGNDTVVFNGNPTQFHLIVTNSGTITISNNTITDTLTQIENIRLSPDLTLDTTSFTKTAQLTKSALVSIVELYIASFNRAPDCIGLDYWGGRLSDGMGLQDIAKSFFVQKEAVAAYPTIMSTNDFVAVVYNNVLSRGPDTGGLNYWVDQLTNGSVSKDTFLLAIINGAMAPTGSAVDRQTLANKEAVGEHYAIYQGLNNSTTWAKDVMSGVTDQMASVAAANSKADNYAVMALAPNTSDLTVKLVGVSV